MFRIPNCQLIQYINLFSSVIADSGINTKQYPKQLFLQLLLFYNGLSKISAVTQRQLLAALAACG